MEFVFYAGFHKTGTSYVQSVLSRNKGILDLYNISYIEHRFFRERFTKVIKGDLLRAHKSGDIATATYLRKVILDSLGREIQGNPKRVLISDENLLGHCGQLVKQGHLYPRVDSQMAHLNREFPFPISQFNIVIRRYDDFFNSVYSEYLRSINANIIISPQDFADQIFHNESRWEDIIDKIAKKIPFDKIKIWEYEDFRAHTFQFIVRLLGPDFDISNLNMEGIEDVRPSISQEAIHEILRIAHEKGPQVAVSQRVEIIKAHSQGSKLDLWTGQEKSVLRKRYEQSLSVLRSNGYLSNL